MSANCIYSEIVIFAFHTKSQVRIRSESTRLCKMKMVCFAVWHRFLEINRELKRINAVQARKMHRFEMIWTCIHVCVSICYMQTAQTGWVRAVYFVWTFIIIMTSNSFGMQLAYTGLVQMLRLSSETHTREHTKNDAVCRRHQITFCHMIFGLWKDQAAISMKIEWISMQLNE